MSQGSVGRIAELRRIEEISGTLTVDSSMLTRRVNGFQLVSVAEDIRLVEDAVATLPTLLDIAESPIALLAVLDNLPYANLPGCDCIDTIGGLRAAIAKLAPRLAAEQEPASHGPKA